MAALFEFGLRLADISYSSFYTRDPARGWALRAGAEGWFRKEGRAHVRINTDGLRDREHAIPKPPATLRIAVLGDSMSETTQVPLESAFWYVLQRRLSGCPALGARKVEVINFGVSGYGTAQELLTLRHHTLKYEPDVVLVAMFTGNDIRNNHRALNGEPWCPYFVHSGGQLVLDDSLRRLMSQGAVFSRLRKIRDAFLQKSRLLQLLYERNPGSSLSRFSMTPRHITPPQASYARCIRVDPIVVERPAHHREERGPNCTRRSWTTPSSPKITLSEKRVVLRDRTL